MAVEKTIRIIVDSDSANTKVKNLDTNLNKLSKTGKKTNFSDSLSKSSEAMDLLDSKTKGLASGFVEVGRAARAGGKAMKSALISSGIGILLVIVTEIVNNWDKIVDFISDANDELERQIEANDRIVSDLEFQLEILRIQKKTLENQGKSTKEINETIKQTIKSQLAQLEIELELLKQQNKRAISREIELTFWQKLQIGANGMLGTVQLISDEEKQQAKERKDNIQDTLKNIETLKSQLSLLAKQEREDTERAIADAKRLNDEKFREFLKENKEAEDGIKQEEREEQEERDYLAETQALLDEEEELRIEAENRRLENLENFLKAEEDLKNKAKRKELLFEENVATAKFNIANNTLNLLYNLSKKGSDLAKGVAIAEVVRNQVASVSGIISNTAEANAKAVALSPLTAGQPFVTLNTISAGLGIAGSVAGGISAIKDITSEKKSVTKGSGGSLPSASRGTSAPSFNLVSGSGSNQIAESLANQSRPLKAFVVSGDVSSAQELDRNIVENSSL